jgi:serine-type D-Ala-D-Ala carboxypeptidase/endopeptidase (penicillin-binding protein 4)
VQNLWRLGALAGLLSLGLGVGAAGERAVGLGDPAMGSILSFRSWRPIEGLKLGAVDIRPHWESAWVRETIANDPAARAIVSGYLSGLSSAGYVSAQQGVWVAADQFPVAEYQGQVPRSAASITKVATTLAALSTWGPMHRFETLVGWQGSLEDGVINGDLLIVGGSDPLFVWEEAIALGNSLQQLGIRKVTGNLVIAGDFTMNFETSQAKSGQLLKQALNSTEWDYTVEEAHRAMGTDIARPTVQINGQVQVSADRFKNQANSWLIRHDSMPLVAVLKAMNIYSNNAMAEQIANTVGGPEAVTQKAAAAAGVSPAEISLVNGSGLGEENKMSPRAAVLMLQEIQYLLRSSAGDTSANFTISDIFPIAGADGGTVQDRSLPENAVVKTGTLAVVSGLAGALPTQKKGVVWFSLLNYGEGLDNLRSRQDKVLSDLEQQWGKADEIPPELQTSVRIGVDPYRVGDNRRNQLLYKATP